MRYFIAILSLAGVLVSALALQVHYSTATEPCSINEHWDCGIVNHSSYSVIFGVPVAAIGIAGYLVLGVLALARRRILLLVAAASRPGLCAPSLRHRKRRSECLVPLLRHLAGNHRAYHAAQPGVAGCVAESNGA